MIRSSLSLIFVVLLLKEVGGPLPVPADLLIVQYLLARGPGRRLLSRVGRYVGLTPVRLERSAQTLQRGGVPAVALGMLALARPLRGRPGGRG